MRQKTFTSVKKCFTIGSPSREGQTVNKRKVDDMTKKLTPKQLAKWLDSLPETTRVWELACSVELTMQQSTALMAKHDANRQALGKLTEQLNNLDSLLTANAESDAGENIRPELGDAELLGYAPHYMNHLIHAAAVHWEGAGRNLNDELGYVVY
jgi:ribonuclease HII